MKLKPRKHEKLTTAGQAGHNGYPRPQLRRENWLNLNGQWDYVIREGEKILRSGHIVVPFSPESDLSGVGEILLPGQTLVYHRKFELPAYADGPESNRRELTARTLLNFGAVDHVCRVFINGYPAGAHEGGYLPFSLDITAFVKPGENSITVEAEDPTDYGEQPRGKQKLKPGKYFYTPQSGIWQTVWLERVPGTYISSLRMTPDTDRGEAVFVAEITGGSAAGEVVVSFNGNLAGRAALDSRGRAAVKLPDARLWSPENPALYDAVITAGGDTVHTYFGMRKIAVKDKRIYLNGKPCFMTGVLDQGYWPESLMTPPSDEAMINDITLMKNMGFNTLRKHLKIEPARWYYHCDRLGMLVWQDLPSGGRKYSKWLTQIVPVVFQAGRKDGSAKKFGRRDNAETEKYRQFALDAADALYNYPCVAVWSVFNESWGQFDSRAVTEAMRRRDNTRLYDSTSGWFDQKDNVSDFCSVHNYYRKITVPGDKRVVALTEFGGYSYKEAGHEYAPLQSYGYKMFADKAAFSEAVARLYESQIIPAVSAGLSACIYTQLSDVEAECNGLVSYDRRAVKMDGARMREINGKLQCTIHNAKCTIKDN